MTTVIGGYGEEMLPTEFVDDLCTHGKLPKNDNGYYPFLAFVIDSQTYPNGTVQTWGANGQIGVEWSNGGLNGQVRINLLGANGKRYCVPEVVSGATYAVTDFSEECWMPGGNSVPGGLEITAVELVMLATDEDQTFEDFCFTNLVNE